MKSKKLIEYLFMYNTYLFIYLLLGLCWFGVTYHMYKEKKKERKKGRKERKMKYIYYIYVYNIGKISKTTTFSKKSQKLPNQPQKLPNTKKEKNSLYIYTSFIIVKAQKYEIINKSIHTRI